MSFGTAIIAVVIVLAITALMMQRNENRSDRIRGEDAGRHREIERERDEARAELADLRERVKVLERIATDPARRTADEIEKLRED